MPMDEEKKLSKGFAFVEFHSREVCALLPHSVSAWVPQMRYAETPPCRLCNRRRRRCGSRSTASSWTRATPSA